jgi:predicted transcriptional regulator
MTLVLTPDTEQRLRVVAAGRGQAPEDALQSILGQALADAEAELQGTLSGLRAGAADFAAGRWTTPEDLDAALRARRP